MDGGMDGGKEGGTRARRLPRRRARERWRQVSRVCGDFLRNRMGGFRPQPRRGALRRPYRVGLRAPCCACRCRAGRFDFLLSAGRAWHDPRPPVRLAQRWVDAGPVAGAEKGGARPGRRASRSTLGRGRGMRALGGCRVPKSGQGAETNDRRDAAIVSRERVLLTIRLDRCRTHSVPPFCSAKWPFACACLFSEEKGDAPSEQPAATPTGLARPAS